MRKDSLDGEHFAIVVGAGISGIGIQHRHRSGYPDTSLLKAPRITASTPWKDQEPLDSNSAFDPAQRYADNPGLHAATAALPASVHGEFRG
ncbi:hypothetical protein [Streptomyces chartreusis]